MYVGSKRCDVMPLEFDHHDHVGKDIEQFMFKTGLLGVGESK